MCCNVWGLGALNVYWVIWGSLMALLNIMPFSLDCSAGMESWMGAVDYECTSLESFLNLMWCFAIVCWCSLSAFLALLPKIKSNYPSDVNKLVMLAVSLAFLVCTALNTIPTLTVEVTFGEQVVKAPPSMVITFGTSTALLLIAMAVHKEPSDGKRLLF